jgi:hypothetical protein
MGAGGAEQPVLRDNEHKEINTRSTPAHSTAKTYFYNNNYGDEKDTQICLFYFFSPHLKQQANKH